MMKLLALRLSDKPGNVIEFIRDGHRMVKFSLGDKLYLIATPVDVSKAICWISEIRYNGGKNPRWVASQGGYERIRLQMFWRNDWNTSIRQFIA